VDYAPQLVEPSICLIFFTFWSSFKEGGRGNVSSATSLASLDVHLRWIYNKRTLKTKARAKGARGSGVWGFPPGRRLKRRPSRSEPGGPGGFPSERKAQTKARAKRAQGVSLGPSYRSCGSV
jgi:hypothetical protein